MTDSLIDPAVTSCRDVIERLEDSRLRRVLRLRLGLLESAAWSIALEPAARGELVSLVKLLVTLREDAVRASYGRAAELVAPRNATLTRACLVGRLQESEVARTSPNPQTADIDVSQGATT